MRIVFAVTTIFFSKVALLTWAVAAILRQAVRAITKRADMLFSVFVFVLLATISFDLNDIALLLVSSVKRSINDVEDIV
jgi:hypothetical protein